MFLTHCGAIKNNQFNHHIFLFIINLLYNYIYPIAEDNSKHNNQSMSTNFDH